MPCYSSPCFARDIIITATALRPDSDKTEVEGYQESSSQDQSNFSGDVSDNQSRSSSTTSVSDTHPPHKGSRTSMKEDFDEVPVTDTQSGNKRKKEKAK